MEAFAPDGDRVWVGGNFVNTAPRTGPGAGIDLNGNRLAGYAELTDSTGALSVDAVTGDGSGGWFVAGSFTKAAGSARPGLVHLKSDGSVDTAFNAQATAGTIRALALSGGVLYAGGSFVSIAGNAHSGLGALNATTGADAGWTANVAGGAVNAIAIQGGFAWVGGTFASIGGQAASRAAKVPIGVGTFAADGTYQPNPNLQVRAVLATASAVYLGGDFATVAGVTSGATSRVSKTNPTTGAPDAAWSPSVTGVNVSGLATDGTNLYAAGNFTNFGGAARNGTASTPLSAVGGGVATNWYPGDLNQGGTPASIAVAGGMVYIGGTFSAAGGGTRTGLAASPADSTGGLSSWNPQTTQEGVRAVAASGSAVYAGGSFTGVGAVPRSSLMALDLLTGAPMPFFSHMFDNDVHTITVCGDTVYVGGVFFNVDGQQRLDAAAFDRNTGALLPWDPAPDGDVWSIACGNGVVYLAGQFVQIAFGTAQVVDRHGLAAVDPVTGADTGWNPAGTSFPLVYSLAVDGSTIYAGGQFAALNGTVRNNVAAIDTAGALTGWDPNVTGAVRALALGGSTIYAAGDFSDVGGGAREGIAEIRLSDGTPTAFDPQADATVFALARAPDGTLYAGGLFSQVGGSAHRGIAAIRPDGTVTSWDPQLQGDVFGVAAGSDGRIYAGGNFTGAASRGTLGIATFSEPTSFATQPALTSAPVEGQATTCDPGTAGGSLPAPQTIQWQLDGADIAGATGTSYTPAATDVAHSLSCHVSQRNMIGTAQADSASMAVAAAPVQQPPTPAPFDIDGFPTPPPPVKGKSVIATPTSGTVLVLLPGFKQFIPLPDAERIPVGTVIDVRHGVVRITTAGAGGKLQSALFWGGVFKVFQEKGRRPMVELRLFGGNFKVCPKIKRARRASLAKVAKTKSIRHLWSSGKGLFRTKGRYASATIRGTKWLTDDRCDGTLVRVTKGAVTVRDFPKRKTLALKAPKRYLARR